MSDKPAYTEKQYLGREFIPLTVRLVMAVFCFAAYFFTNTFLVAIWFLTGGIHLYFWPIWPMIGWGLGIAFQYIGAYQSHKFFTAEDEYERLKNQYQ